MMKSRKIGPVRLPTARGVKAFLTHYLGGLYRRADEHHVFLFGSGLAFSVFLCVIPLVLVVYSILGGLSRAGSVNRQVNSIIDAAVPYTEYADYARLIIHSRMTAIFEYKTLAGWIGGFGLFFTASGLFSSIRTVLDSVFGVKAEKSPVLGKLRDFGMVLFTVVFILMATVVLPAADVLKSVLRDWTPLKFLKFGGLENLVVSAASFLIIFAAFYFCYRFIPDARPGRKVPAVSALWAAIFWEIAKRLFGYYLYHFASFEKIYGAYTFVVVLAFWIYYSSVLLIIGAEIGQLYRERAALKSGADGPARPKSGPARGKSA